MRYFNQIFQGFLLFLQLDLSRMNLNIITTVSGIDFIKFAQFFIKIFIIIFFLDYLSEYST